MERIAAAIEQAVVDARVEAAEEVGLEWAGKVEQAVAAATAQHAWMPDPHRCLDCAKGPEAPAHALDLWERLKADGVLTRALVDKARVIHGSHSRCPTNYSEDVQHWDGMLQAIVAVEVGTGDDGLGAK